MENVKNELGRFLMVGIIVVATDAIIYYSLLFFLQPWLAKTIAFICGTIVAYLANKFWTFKKSGFFHKEIIRFIFLYTFAIIINVGINSLILFLYNSLIVAYFLATGISASFNFIGQKFFVFKRNV